MDNRAVVVLALLGVALWGLPSSGHAQGSPRGSQVWQASARYDYDRLSGGRTDWHRWTVSLKRAIPGGTIMASLIQQRRFGIADAGGAVDVWQDLWQGAYGHLRVGLSPEARIRSRRIVTSNLYQSLGPWEVSGHYSWRRYRRDAVHLFGPGLARYVGAWYLRTRTTVAPRPGTWAIAQRVGARRFYSSAPSSYVDAEVGIGRSVELVGADAELLVTRTYFASVRIHHFVTAHLGVTAGLRYSDDGVFRRTGGSVGLIGRW
ncbi:MAG: YaiO family outer membrane beta-barrel protein [Salinibacter sp.]